MQVSTRPTTPPSLSYDADNRPLTKSSFADVTYPPKGYGNMSDENTPASRREVLKKSAIASGVFVVGGSAVGTVAAGRGKGNAKGGGGSGFLSPGAYNALKNTKFEIVREINWTLEHSAGCSGNGKAKTKTFQGYRVEPESGQHRHLYIEPNRNVNLGVWQEIASAHDCPPDAPFYRGDTKVGETPVKKIAFKPV